VKVIETKLPGVRIIEPQAFVDSRGFFVETYRTLQYRQDARIDFDFVQDNHSRSPRGVLRGLHAQRLYPQGKLVRCSRGEVYDVAVDINPQSKTFGVWVGAILSDQNFRQLWIPPGYAHGFVVLSEIADFQYRCTDYYHPEDEIGLIWNDPEVEIDWPIKDPRLSAKDLKLPTLADLRLRQ
jgi:dTDP-4-dehydrorhamnose 3,5-epimerase